MKPNLFRRVRHPLRMVMHHGWRWGGDPRRIPFGLSPLQHPQSTCLISPKGTVFECRIAPGGLHARRYHHHLHLHEN